MKRLLSESSASRSPEPSKRRRVLPFLAEVDGPNEQTHGGIVSNSNGADVAFDDTSSSSDRSSETVVGDSCSTISDSLDSSLLDSEHDESSENDGSTSDENSTDESENDESSSNDGSGSESANDSSNPPSSPPLINLPAPKKPPASKTNPQQNSDLLSRLSSFLPQMAAANTELENFRAAGKLGERNIENLDEDGESHIEMNLGLGVLEEQNPSLLLTRRELDSRSSTPVNDIEASQEPGGLAKENDVMSRLLGRKQSRPNIQEVKIR